MKIEIPSIQEYLEKKFDELSVQKTKLNSLKKLNNVDLVQLKDESMNWN